MIEYESIPPETCMHCHRGETPHRDWHSTRAEYLKIGVEMTRRVREREAWTIRQMPDQELVAYGIRMRRLRASATEDNWPELLLGLIDEWVGGAEKEWGWRKRAARLGADAVIRSGGSWPERAEAVKRSVDLMALIGFENGRIEMHGPTKFSCQCPFHDDRDPSLDVDTMKGVWLCRACQIGGDAIRYVELREGLMFSAAVVRMEERMGIRPPERRIDGVQIVRADGRR
jgi:hypothetical protein